MHANFTRGLGLLLALLLTALLGSCHGSVVIDGKDGSVVIDAPGHGGYGEEHEDGSYGKHDEDDDDDDDDDGDDDDD